MYTLAEYCCYAGCSLMKLDLPCLGSVACVLYSRIVCDSIVVNFRELVVIVLQLVYLTDYPNKISSKPYCEAIIRDCFTVLNIL